MKIWHESAKKGVLITHRVCFRHPLHLYELVAWTTIFGRKINVTILLSFMKTSRESATRESFFRTTTSFLPPSPTVPASSFRLFWTGQKLHLGGSSLSEWKTPNPLLRFGIAWSNNTFQTLGMAFKKQNQFYVLSDYQKGAVFWYRRCGGRQILLSVTWDL